MRGYKVCSYIIIFILCLFCFSGCAADSMSAEGKILFLIYHDFKQDKLSPSDDPVIVTTAEKFEKDIKGLFASGYHSLSLEDYYKKRYNPSKNYFVITMDDGYLSNYTIAYPLLIKLNVKADIFINTDNVWMEHHFKYDQAKEMESSGLVKIYSHFPTHISVLDLSDEEFKDGVLKSFEDIESNLGDDRTRFFAYPYGYYDERTYHLAKECDVMIQVIQQWQFDAKDFVYRHNVGMDDDIKSLLAVKED